MDENRDSRMEHEVVLRYRPQPRPVVERYRQREPLPRAREHPPDAAPDPVRAVEPIASIEEMPSRRWPWIALICLGVMLLAAVVTDISYRRELLRQEDSYYEYERREQRGETSIERYPNEEGVHLRFAETHGEELAAQQIYELVNPSTVTVATSLPSGNAIIGTGVIFTEDGYILTNAHVISGGQACFAVLYTGVSYEAKLVGFDEEKDLAVIKINGSGLPAAEFGDSDALTVGDPVYAIGNPLGVELRGTLTNGIVSAINRNVNVDGVNMTLIQTNAALNNGNSGGPLINHYGQVVGINTMKMGSGSTVSVEGLGFAIPISSSAYMINDLIAYGEIRGEPVIGIMVHTVNLDGEESVVEVVEVTAGGPGEQAGLLPGDRILEADGEALHTTNDLLRIRRRHSLGEAITLLIERDGERMMTSVILAVS